MPHPSTVRALPIRTLRAVVLFALILALLPACFNAGNSYDGGGWPSVRTRTAPAGKRFDLTGGDHYLAVTGKRKGSGNLFWRQIDRDLWPPFRWECRAGKFDPASEGDGVACLEIDVRGTSPPEFFSVCVEPVESGAHVFATSERGVALGQRLLSGADVVDLAIEHDGQTITFLARPEGEGSYQTIATTVMGAPAKAFIPSLLVTRQSKGEELGFDLMRVTQNGSAPGEVSPRKDAANSVFLSVDALAEAVYALDTPSSDRASAATFVADALAGLDTAALSVGALGKAKPVSKAARSLKQARKKLAAAGGALSGGGADADVAKLLAKSMVKLFDAVRHLDPLRHD